MRLLLGSKGRLWALLTMLPSPVSSCPGWGVTPWLAALGGCPV